MDRPPSRVEWALDAELNGHSHEQILGYLSWVDAWESEQVQRRAAPIGPVPAIAERQAPRWLRRWFGR